MASLKARLDSLDSEMAVELDNLAKLYEVRHQHHSTNIIAFTCLLHRPSASRSWQPLRLRPRSNNSVLFEMRPLSQRHIKMQCNAKKSESSHANRLEQRFGLLECRLVVCIVHWHLREMDKMTSQHSHLRPLTLAH